MFFLEIVEIQFLKFRTNKVYNKIFTLNNQVITEWQLEDLLFIFSHLTLSVHNIYLIVGNYNMTIILSLITISDGHSVFVAVIEETWMSGLHVPLKKFDVAVELAADGALVLVDGQVVDLPLVDGAEVGAFEQFSATFTSARLHLEMDGLEMDLQRGFRDKRLTACVTDKLILRLIFPVTK